jgi:hypothetical protein
MSRRKPREPGRAPIRDENEAIALRIHQIAAVAGVMAESQEAPLSHALYLIEESLLDIEARLTRPAAPNRRRAAKRRLTRG